MLATITCGQPAATHPVAILTHGVTDSAASLAHLAAWLAPHHHVVAVDLPGHGLSPALPPTALADPFPTIVSQLAAVVDSVAAPHGLIGCGHSMGAAALTRLADRFDALILDDPAWLSPTQHEYYRDAGPRTADTIRAYRQDPLAAYRYVRTAYPYWPETEYPGWLAGKLQVDLDLVATGIVSDAADWPELAAGITVPTLLVTGTADDVLNGPARTFTNPLISAHVIDGASHTTRRDRPAQFYHLAQEFLHVPARR